MDYDFWLSSEASRSLLSSPAPISRRMEQALAALAAHPFREPDFRERGPSGRTYDVTCYENIILTYWVDHATKEVRIIRCESV